MQSVDLDNTASGDEGILSGTTKNFRDLEANFDLTPFLACPDNGVMYMCVELRKGVNPSADFRLEGNLRTCSPVECRGKFYLILFSKLSTNVMQ